VPTLRRSALWRNPAFVRVWTAATISIFGSLVSGIALPWAAILVLGAGPLELAAIGIVELAAGLLVGLVAGAWIDRLRRRPVLIWADLGRAALLVSIPVAFMLSVLSLGQLLVVAFLASVLTTFFDSADNAYLPTIVERDQLVEANAALAATGSAAEFTAFGVAGFLVQLLSAPLAILIDAASFLISAALLGSISRPEAPPPPRADRRPVVAEIRDGLRLVVRDPALRAFAVARMAMAATYGVFGGLWLLFVTRDLGLGPAVIGLIAGVGGVASLAGAAVVARSTRRWGVGPVAAAALALTAIGNFFIPLAPAGAPLVAAACLIAAQLVGDSSATVHEVVEASVRQGLVPDRALGRVASTFRVADVLVQLVAMSLGALLAELTSVRTAVTIAPFGAVVAAIILWWSPARNLRVLPATGTAEAAGR
jgi:Na+/melibiose symporter-like transporter